MRNKIVTFLNSLFPIVLACVVLGGYYIQITRHELPCPLCMLQRIAMIGTAMGPLLNLRFGFSTSHYAISLFAAIFGGSISLRQICLHICPGFPTFGEPVLGLSLYTWAFIVFASSIFAVAILLLMHTPSKDFPKPRKVAPLGMVAFGLVLLVAFADVITTFMECGLSACVG